MMMKTVTAAEHKRCREE